MVMVFYSVFSYKFIVKMHIAARKKSPSAAPHFGKTLILFLF